MTTGYNAGLDSSDLKISYTTESTWSVIPSAIFAQLRVTAEDFTSTKTRTRPLEINPSGYAAHSITTQIQAKGSMNFGLSYGTFDDFLAGSLNSSWSTALAIAGIGGDIAMSAPTAGVSTLTSTLTGKWTTVKVGQWIRTLGFTNAANNGIFQVTALTATVLTLAVGSVVTVAETPSGTAAKIRGSFVANSNTVTTFVIQKQLAAALFFQYVGSYVSSLQLTMEVGKFVEGVLNFLVKGQTSATVEAGTATPTGAPTGRIIDNIGGFSAFKVNGTAPTAVLQSVELTVSKERSASQYGIGTANAVGMRRGTIQVDGKLSLFFLDLTYYNDFVNETDLGVSFQLTDNLGQAYVITLPAISIMNPSIVAKGIDQDVIADFTLEANPALATDPLYPNLTIQIDRLPIT